MAVAPMYLNVPQGSHRLAYLLGSYVKLTRMHDYLTLQMIKIFQKQLL